MRSTNDGPGTATESPHSPRALGRLGLARILFIGCLGLSLATAFANDAAADQGVGQKCSAFKKCGGGLSCMPLRQRCHRDSGAVEGEACQAGYGCASGFTCEAGTQVCHGGAKAGDACHATHPCGAGLSCQPGVQKCYHSPRQDGEPCVAGYACGSGLACAAVHQICYQLPPTAPFANGQKPRPFYIVGHNPNTIAEMTGDLEAGANALEPDIMKFTGNAEYYAGKHLNDKAGKSGLFVYHDHVAVTSREPLTVEAYFAAVAGKINAGKNVALITVDTKPQAYGYGKELVEAVHEAFANVAAEKRPWIIYSTGDINDKAKSFYQTVAPLLNDHEGIMSDGNNDPNTVYTMLQTYTKNVAYGTGGQGITSGSFRDVGRFIDHATWYRTSQGYTASVPYVYPIPAAAEAGGIDWWGSFMDSDVDGLIPDLDLNPVAPATTQSQIKKLRAKVDSSKKYYAATASDNPFHQGQEGYALKILTGTNGTSSAGTDGYVTFTIKGKKGTSSGVFNGRTQIGSNTRFHDNNTDYLVIPSKDLGKLQSLTMYVSGNVLHSWKVSQIQISSPLHHIPYSSAPTIAIDKTVTTTTPVTIDLTSKKLGKE